MDVSDVLCRVYKSSQNFRDLEKHLTYFLVVKEYPLPQTDIKFDEIKEEMLFDQNFQHQVRTYAQKLIEYCFTVMRKTSFITKFAYMINFWGVSRPFCKTRCQRLAEFYVNKYSHGRKNDNCCKTVWKKAFSHWQKRWFAVGYNSVWYYQNPEDEPHMMKDNIPMDQTASLRIIEISKKHVTFELLMSRRKLLLRLKDFTTGLYALRTMIKAFTSSFYTTRHRFLSFAPPRLNNDCEFFIDGEGYFKKLHDLIDQAKQEIMICGWFISPEMPLLRPIEGNLENSESRLDRMLKKAADKGVFVYVLVYKEFEISMYNDSEHCKKVLEKQSKNIKVLRHPMKLVSLWSHHEKMVIIDRKVVMMGGLDICWGRWDTNDHLLFDYVQDGLTYPNIDYYNPFKKEIIHGKDYHKSMINRYLPRMPWHDVGVMLVGQVVFDFLTHFVTYWNNAIEFHDEKEVLFPLAPLKDARVVIDEGVLTAIQQMINELPEGDEEQQASHFEAMIRRHREAGMERSRPVQNPEYHDTDDDPKDIAFKDIELIKNEAKNEDKGFDNHGEEMFRLLDDCYYEDVSGEKSSRNLHTRTLIEVKSPGSDLSMNNPPEGHANHHLISKSDRNLHDFQQNHHKDKGSDHGESIHHPKNPIKVLHTVEEEDGWSNTPIGKHQTPNRTLTPIKPGPPLTKGGVDRKSVV